MKRLIVFTFVMIFTSSCQKRIADLTLVSTRNIENNVEYRELSRYVVGKDKALHTVLFIGPLFAPDIEDAIDDAVKKIPNGEYMKNAVLKERYIPFIFFTLRTFKIEGDVWGKGIDDIENGAGFKVGDEVIVKVKTLTKTKFIDAKIVSITANSVIVYRDHKGEQIREEFKNELIQKK